MDTPRPDLDGVVARVLAGDVSAFQEIVRATSGRLVRLGARMTGSVADAEDVVQEAYVKAYQALLEGRFDGRASVETWLYRIVANGSIDAMRSRARRPVARDTLTEPAFDGAASAAEHVALAELGGWLAELPVEQRAALTLTAVEGLSAAEASEVLGISEGAVEQRVVRARTALRARRGGRDA